jgi:hypothetical protein
MAVFTITADNIGETLMTDGAITGVSWAAHDPPVYDQPTGDARGWQTGVFNLVDVTPLGVTRNLLCADTQTNGGIPPVYPLLDGAFTIPFGSLIVQCCPRGTTWTITTDP